MPRYICLAPGYDGISLRLPGDEFDYSGEPAEWMEEIGGAKGSDGPTKKDIMAQLDELKVVYIKNSSKEDLAALLAKTEADAINGQ